MDSTVPLKSHTAKFAHMYSNQPEGEASKCAEVHVMTLITPLENALDTQIPCLQGVPRPSSHVKTAENPRPQTKITGRVSEDILLWKQYPFPRNIFDLLGLTPLSVAFFLFETVGAGRVWVSSRGEAAWPAQGQTRLGQCYTKGVMTPEVDSPIERERRQLEAPVSNVSAHTCHPGRSRLCGPAHFHLLMLFMWRLEIQIAVQKKKNLVAGPAGGHYS